VGQVDAGTCAIYALDPSQIAIGEKIADDALILISRLSSDVRKFQEYDRRPNPALRPLSITGHK